MIIPDLTKQEWNMILQMLANKKTNGANKAAKNASRQVAHDKVAKAMGKCLHKNVHIKELD